MTEHERIHRNERPYECHICQKTFIQNGSLLNHLKIHADVREYKCKICEKGFNQVATLQKHVKSHEKDATNDCASLMGELLKEHRMEECQESNELPLQLLETEEVEQEVEFHIEREEAGEAKGVPVESTTVVDDITSESVEQKPKPEKKDLKITIRTKVQKRLIQCEVCGVKMKFSEKKFVTHYRTKHSPSLDIQLKASKNRSCSFCEKSFASSTDLLIHNRVHTGERPYQCEICKS